MNGRIGLIGDPVAHSLSPSFQQAAFDALGIPIRYELWQTSRDQIPERIAAIRNGEIIGANVTVPHKEAFFAAVDETSDRARHAGAVNTLFLRDGKLIGDNTDIPGFLAPLLERGFPFSERQAIILGAGGAARGVAVALLDAGIASLTIANRTLERADRLASDLDDERIGTTPLGEIRSYLPQTDLIINATALGWHDESPLPDADFESLPGTAIAYDLTYRGTPFLHTANAAGLQAIDGLPMLVHQGAHSFEIWTGKQAPLQLMMQAAIEARASRA